MWLVAHKPIIDVITEMATSVGTLLTVITALWLSRQDRVKLRPSALISVLMPDDHKYLCMSCVNVGRPSAICTGIVFAPNRFGNLRIMPMPSVSLVGYQAQTLPASLQFGEKVSLYFYLESLNNEQIKKLVGKCKFLARVRLKYLWRVVATTNLSQFYAPLSDSLIDELMAIYFPKKNN